MKFKFLLTMFLAVAFMAVSLQAQTHQTKIKRFTTVALMNAFTPDPSKGEAMMALVTDGSLTSTLYHYDQPTSTWTKSGELDTDTDEQDLLTPTIAGTVVTFGIEDGNSANFDFGVLQDGTGTDDQTAAEVPITTIEFNNNLSSSDTDIQTALETIDDLVLGTDTQQLSVGGGGIELVDGGSVQTDDVIKQLKGPFISDAAATTVASGERYILDANNRYAEAKGTIREKL